MLEADVNYKVAKEFIARTRERALGQDVLGSVTPGQQIVKIVHDELVRLMGGGAETATTTPPPALAPGNILMVGLHGCGKTTTSAKLALRAGKAGRKPLLVACDVYRPAAIDQLETLGKQLQLPTFAVRGESDVLAIAEQAGTFARAQGCDLLIFDTAGRLHIDEDLVQELVRLREFTTPREILLVADAATGQEAVNIAEHFDRALGITGIVLTKLDGDARGGAALSIRHVTGVPIKFVGTGERPDEFEPFHPDRMVGRILGMGDVLTLIEKAEEAIDEREAKQLEKKLRKNEFTLQDFRDQLRNLRRMGPLSGIVQMLPGMSHIKETDLDTRAIVRVVAIIDSMTPKERRFPRLLNARRKRRIAKGSGQSVQEINRLLKQFAQMKRMMKSVQAMAKGGKHGRRGKMPNRGGLPFFGR